jgi:hypothetical protein
MVHPAAQQMHEGSEQQQHVSPLQVRSVTVLQVHCCCMQGTFEACVQGEAVFDAPGRVTGIRWGSWDPHALGQVHVGRCQRFVVLPVGEVQHIPQVLVLIIEFVLFQSHKQIQHTGTQPEAPSYGSFHRLGNVEAMFHAHPLERGGTVVFFGQGRGSHTASWSVMMAPAYSQMKVPPGMV